MGDYHFFARFVPAAVLVEAGEGADGSDDRVGGGEDALGLFDEIAEGVAGLFGSELGEAEGAGVPPDNAAVAEVEFVGDDGWTVPVEDTFLDGFAFGVVADGAVGDVSVKGAVGVPVGATPAGMGSVFTLVWP
ncbi:MAG TPA: hypothetical protein VGR36_04610 [Candidatus Acidoferrales bacterium]|nr:hypothetical protein [Candidatus Acidoferrales bacterium]